MKISYFTTMVEYRDRLTAAMKAASISASQLAERLNTSYQAVKKVIDGKSSAFNAANNAIAARMLDVSSDWLALGSGPMTRNEGAISANVPWPIPCVSETQVHALSETQRHMLGDVIAQAIAQLALGIDISANTWPFSSLTPEQWSMLTERQRGRAEGYIQSFVQEAESLAVKSTASARAA